MACITPSKFTSRSFCGNIGLAAGPDLKLINGPKNQIAAHNGLRALKYIDMLLLRANAKAPIKHLRGGLGDVLGGLPPAMSAALEAPRALNLISSKHFTGAYGEAITFIANDWHTALLPCYLKSMYKSRKIYRNAKVAFCIHNVAYQGRFAFSDFSILNLPNHFMGSFDFVDGYDKPVKGRKLNWMKAGILESDMVLTVSPYYAEELVSGIEKGVELDNIIRTTGITGIVNGMDVQEWDPSSDKYINIKCRATTVMEAKPLLKEALQAELGLPVDRNIPMIGFVVRLEEQKGSDILAEAIP
ncbi:hypothetical protein Nepgr_010669 [Nepenthes gracilis]|uniref:Starch synthase catalytic domain-containing protein n=1 Tax=Nepenthes gracilis TaxID=150966 RepID=A0AAD3SDC7_NEPGR|nr:hypothetical protein Nepgr_010669 [Nepenthes gracilis]